MARGADTPERHRRASALFLEVCEMDTEERSTVLDLRCADDPELRVAVEALIAQDRTAEQDALLARPVREPTVVTADSHRGGGRIAGPAGTARESPGQAAHGSRARRRALGLTLALAALALLLWRFQASRALATADAARELSALIAALPVSTDALERVHAAQELRRIAEEADRRIAGAPGLLADVHLALGRAFMRLEAALEAEPHLRAALEARRQSLGAGHRDTLAAARELAVSLHALGQLAEAEALLRETLGLQIAAFGHTDADTLATARSLADRIEPSGQKAQAERLREAAEHLGGPKPTPLEMDARTETGGQP